MLKSGALFFEKFHFILIEILSLVENNILS